tara:strand:+ start:69 stop:413 length:345 start_codon:yes stop_codon:yes gene_type:complete
MRFFSPPITRFLFQVDRNDPMKIHIVPKSASGINKGRLVMFLYQGSWIVVLSVSPVVKDAKTGNKLFTGFKVPFAADYTPDSLVTLYKNKELPEENYRTYILSKIQSPVWRIEI